MDAKCTAANLNALEEAIEHVADDAVRWRLSSVAGVLRANLYAVFYDVLPTIEGQKQWPPINEGDTWEVDGRAVPYRVEELDAQPNHNR